MLCICVCVHRNVITNGQFFPLEYQRYYFRPYKWKNNTEGVSNFMATQNIWLPLGIPPESFNAVKYLLNDYLRWDMDG